MEGVVARSEAQIEVEVEVQVGVEAGEGWGRGNMGGVLCVVQPPFFVSSSSVSNFWGSFF